MFPHDTIFTFRFLKQPNIYVFQYVNCDLNNVFVFRDEEITGSTTAGAEGRKYKLKFTLHINPNHIWVKYSLAHFYWGGHI